MTNEKLVMHMYNVILGAQIVAVLVCLLSIVLLLYQRNTQQSKMMLLTIVCAFIQNFGYLLELTSTDLGEVMIAIQVEYVGTAYIAYFLTVFMLRYSNIRVSEKLSWVWFSFSTIVLCCVLTYKVNTIYYSSVDFVHTGFFSHVVLGKGPLYILNALTIYGGLIASCIISFRSFRRVEDKRMQTNHMLLCIGAFIPLLCHLGGMFNIIPSGYDMAPLGVAIGVLIFSYAIAKRRIFDVIEVAHENILTNMEDAVVIVDAAYCYMEANHKAVELFPSLAKCYPGDKLEDVLLLHSMKESRDRQIVLGDSYYRVHVNEVINNHELGGYVALFLDMTDSINQLERMRELKEQADHANMAKSLFLANMSHEIRTPINAILGINEVILRDYEEPQLTEYSRRIQNATKALLALVNDILDFSRIEAGKIEIRPEIYDVKNFIQGLTDTFQDKAVQKQLEFVTELGQDLPEKLFGDATRVRQVAVNLLSNAVKYTNQGFIKMHILCQRQDIENVSLIISIEDSGIGIREEDMPKLFERFERLDENRNRTIEGVGLGLNITKKIVRVMGGDLKVYSVYGRGSVFTAIIPQKLIIADEKYEMKNEAEFTAPAAKILLVDDSQTNLMVEQALLQRTKAQMTAVLSGKECLEEIQKEHYDLIFLDHRMPDMDGIETLRRIRSMHSMCESTPVVMLTANAVNDARNDYLQMGFDEFLSKPVDSKMMEDMVQKFLREDLIIRA